MDYLVSTTCRESSILQLTPDEKPVLRTPKSYPKNVMSDPGQRGRLLHNEQCAPSYSNVSFAKAPNLHAGSCQAEMRKERRLRCSLFSSLRPLAFLVFLLSDWWEVCATSAAVGGGASGPPQAGAGRGCLPPPTATLEVTRPEPRNDRGNTRKTSSFLQETSTWK
jgi:hypothetical protein